MLETINKYEKQGIECYHQKVNEYYVVKRKLDGKVLKGVEFKEPRLKQFVCIEEHDRLSTSTDADMPSLIPIDNDHDSGSSPLALNSDSKALVALTIPRRRLSRQLAMEGVRRSRGNSQGSDSASEPRSPE